MQARDRCSQSYPLERDATEHARLAAQASFWSPDAAALFDAAGVGIDQTVADLGCGTLHVAKLLAARVGPKGHVKAQDNDATLLASLVGEAAAIDTAPVSLQYGDAYATGWPDAQLDAAHARFVAAPVGRLEVLVSEMRRIVRPGGLVLMQEPNAETWSLGADGSTWPRLLALIRAGFAQRGGNFDAGLDIATALHAAGMRQIEQRAVVRRLPPGHAYAALPLAFARQLRPLWLQAEMISAPALDDLLAEVSESLRSERSATTFTLVQAWGRRPS